MTDPTAAPARSGTAAEPGEQAGSPRSAAPASGAGAEVRSGSAQLPPHTPTSAAEADSSHGTGIATTSSAGASATGDSVAAGERVVADISADGGASVRGSGPQEAKIESAENAGGFTDSAATADSGRSGKTSGGTAGVPGDPDRPRTVVLRVPRLRRPTLPALIAVPAMLAAVVFGVLWRSDAGELADLRADLAGDRRAEEVAGDYALRVSRVEHTDLDGWRRALQTGVGAELAPKLSAAVDVVGPWLAQMEYRATGTLLAAQVTARDGDNYTVAAFVEMRSAGRQTPTGVTATAAYTITLNRAADWTITDVGGSGLAPAGVPAPGDAPAAPAAEPPPAPPR